jgi:hypothetical protein
MGNKGRKDVLDGELQQFNPLIEDEVPDTPEDEAIWSIMSELSETGSDAVISVYKILDEKDKRAGSFLFRDNPVDFNRDGMERIRDGYGGGMYRVHIKNIQGRMISNQCVTIADPPKKPEVPKNEIDIVTMVNTMMEKQNQNLLQVLTPLLQKPAQDNEMLFLEKMTKYKELFGSGEKSNNGLGATQVLSILQQGMELAQNASGEAKEETMFSVMREFAPKILELVTNAGRNTAPAILPMLPQAPAAMPAPVTQGQPENMHLRILLSTLMPAAMHNRDVQLYADLIIDQLGEEKAVTLTLQDFANIAPDVHKYSAWFNAVIHEVQAAFDAPQETTQITTQAQGDEDMFNMFIKAILSMIEKGESAEQIAATIVERAGADTARAMIGNPALIQEMQARVPAVANHVPKLEEIIKAIQKTLDK